MQLLNQVPIGVLDRFAWSWYSSSSWQSFPMKGCPPQLVPEDDLLLISHPELLFPTKEPDAIQSTHIDVFACERQTVVAKLLDANLADDVSHTALLDDSRGRLASMGRSTTGLCLA